MTMLAINSTDARNEWSAIVDSVVREKPRFIKRTRDYLMLSDIKLIELLLSAYTFTAKAFHETDGSVTLSLNELDLVENGADMDVALLKLAEGILEYAQDFYDDFAYWSTGHRKAHIPYVIKSLIINDIDKIGGLIQCQPGKN